MMKHDLEMKKQTVDQLIRCCHLYGLVVGLILQSLAIAAVLFLWTNVVDDHEMNYDDPTSRTTVCLNAFIALLCRLVLAVLPVAWGAPILMGVTGLGSHWFEDFFCSTSLSGNEILRTCITFLSGLSKGTFVSTLALDVVLGYPIPVGHIFGMLVICLASCLALFLFYYDAEDTKKQTAESPSENSKASLVVQDGDDCNRDEDKNPLSEPLIL